MRITNIAKNTSYFTLALVLQKAVAFLYFTLVARNLPPEDLGRFYLAVSLTTMFAIIIDIGLSNVLVREVAKGEGARLGVEMTNKLLGTVLGIKLPLAGLAIAAVAFSAHLLGYPTLVIRLVYISALAMALDSFTLTFYAVIRGHHNLKYESIGSVVFQVIVLGLGLAVLKSGAGLEALMAVMVAASLFNCLFSLIILKRKLGIRVRPAFDRVARSAILKIAWPFALFALLQRLFTYLDTVLLSVLADERSVGLYQVAFKIIFALQFLPLAFTASLYPAFASYWKENTATNGASSVGALRAMPLRPLTQLTVTFERAMNYLAVISLPVALGGIAVGDRIIAIFKPEYADALLPLKITLLALPFMFLNFPIGSLMNACDRQATNTKVMGLGLAISVLLNALLIPSFGAVGAAVTVLAANAAMFAVSFILARSITPYRTGRIAASFAKAFLAALVMAGLAWYLKAFWPIIVVVPVSGVAYFALLLVLRVIRKEDARSVIMSFFHNA